MSAATTPRDCFVAWDIETDCMAPPEWDAEKEDEASPSSPSSKRAKLGPMLNVTVAATRRTLPDGTEEALVWASPTAESGLNCPVPEEVYSALSTEEEEKEEAASALLFQPRMTTDDVAAMATYLLRCCRDEGCAVSTYNGLGFDFRVVYEILRCRSSDECEEDKEEDLADSFKALAASSRHFDIAFSFFAHRGFMVSLAKATEATVGPSLKKYEISGADAPAKFMESRRWQNVVVKYCAQDVRMQAALQRRLAETGELRWVTKKGTVSSWRVPSVRMSKAKKKKSKDEDDGPASLLNLGVAHSRTVPMPDVEWMAKFDMKPWKRSKFEAWLGRC